MIDHYLESFSKAAFVQAKKKYLPFSLHSQDAKLVKCCKTLVSTLTSLNVKNQVKIELFHEQSGAIYSTSH